jgi:hypothetical protein
MKVSLRSLRLKLRIEIGALYFWYELYFQRSLHYTVQIVQDPPSDAVPDISVWMTACAHFRIENQMKYDGSTVQHFTKPKRKTYHQV